MKARKPMACYFGPGVVVESRLVGKRGSPRPKWRVVFAVPEAGAGLARVQLTLAQASAPEFADAPLVVGVTVPYLTGTPWKRKGAIVTLSRYGLASNEADARRMVSTAAAAYSRPALRVGGVA